MLIYRYCCLRAAVAVYAIEIEGGDAMFTEGAPECGAAVRRLGCVISHIFIVVSSSCAGFWALGVQPWSRIRLVASGESKLNARRVSVRLLRIG
jgi:hypothetical protein